MQTLVLGLKNGTTGELIPIKVDDDGKLLVAGITLEAGTVNIGSEVEVKNDSGNPIPVTIDVSEYGTAGTGISAPTGATGLTGWLSGIFSKLSGVLTVSGSAAAGSAPTSAPLSVSGVDAGGLKRHFKTDTAGNQGIYGAAARSLATANIANGASVSGAIDLSETALLGFIMPSAWTAAALNIEVSPDNSRWITAGAYNADGSLVTSFSSVAVDTAYAVDTLALMPYRYVRFRSGTSGSPVNQGASRDITVITRPLA